MIYVWHSLPRANIPNCTCGFENYLEHGHFSMHKLCMVLKTDKKYNSPQNAQE